MSFDAIDRYRRIVKWAAARYSYTVPAHVAGATPGERVYATGFGAGPMFEPSRYSQIEDAAYRRYVAGDAAPAAGIFAARAFPGYA